MLTKAKMLYQVKLILDYLPEEEYNLIPKETINYIEDNFEYDENIKIDPNIPLENQNIDDSSYKYLEKIIAEAEKNQKASKNKELEDYIKDVKESNKNFETNVENIRLKELVELLKKENGKIPKIKSLVEDYKNALEEKNKKIEELKKNNKYLIELFNRIPKFIRKFFIKDDIKLLNEGGKIMKAKLIYEQGKSYYGGRNPYNDDWKYVIEYNGKYYELHQWGNYNSRGKTLIETDFDPENIPEEYERDDGNTEYYLKHGNNSVMEIDLTEIDNSGGPLSIPESLVGEYKKEYREKMRGLNKNLMQLTIDKVEEYKEKEEYGKGYASIMYATTSKGTKIILYDYHHKNKIMPNHGSDIDNRQYLYPIELWEWAKKNYGSRYDEMPYDISSFELVSSEEVEREECIKISDYIFSGPDMVGRDVSKEYEEIKDKIYQEYREAYDLEMIGTFETYCPLEYQKMLERENISEEQKEIIKKLAKMRAYCKDSYLKEKMDEKIEEFINGKAIFVKGDRFAQGYDKVLESMSAYDAKDVENVREPDVMSFLWSDDVKIISLGDKQIELPNGEKYNGTYKAGGKYWDVLIDSEENIILGVSCYCLLIDLMWKLVMQMFMKSLMKSVGKKNKQEENFMNLLSMMFKIHLVYQNHKQKCC